MNNTKPTSYRSLRFVGWFGVTLVIIALILFFLGAFELDRDYIEYGKVDVVQVVNPSHYVFYTKSDNRLIVTSYLISPENIEINIDSTSEYSHFTYEEYSSLISKTEFLSITVTSLDEIEYGD